MDLKGAILDGANLSGSFLEGANLCGAHLNGANLGGAILLETIFGDTKLKGMEGFDACRHWGPSTLTIEPSLTPGLSS